ncbi:RES domain-containing protein [Belnapia sp. T6]|uniref:RES domain-containing protein n=1 Tax=Belnapia mucosa TaxID=2804532 RepID=A0ABS1VCG6_9PROT|nr:RES family NAD+ phosphorylase [Belnapia mucosa]MBL6459359.1 RES domain-containing protein [Belnapia mucosa]
MLPEGTPLWRVHSALRLGNVFNPCMGDHSRFSPLYDVAGECIPTLYAGRTREAAAFETIFRNLPLLPLPRQVFARRITGSALSELRPRRTFRLAALYNAELALVGQSRLTMIESHGTAAYRETARWAEAIHRDLPDFDGLIWTSRQQDEVQAMLLYGTRITPADLEVVATETLDTGPGRQWVSDMAIAYKIDLIPA